MDRRHTPHDEAAPRASLVGAMEAIADEAGPDGLTLHELMEKLGERVFGAVLFVLALPCCIPFLYGVPQVVALPMTALALQLALGRSEPWLPARFAGRRIGKDGLARMARMGRRWFGWLDRFTRPRLTILVGPIGERVIGAALCVFCGSILTPLPLTNTVPGFAVAATSLGMLERDGLVIIGGLVLGVAWVAALVLFGAEGVRLAVGALTGVFGSGG